MLLQEFQAHPDSLTLLTLPPRTEESLAALTVFPTIWLSLGTHASARSTMVLMSAQRRVESFEQVCRIHSLRSVTTCGGKGSGAQGSRL
jgi:hypothetical protein